MIGRKGTLTIIYQNTGEHFFTWAVSNSRILCFYESKAILTINRLYRNTNISVKDINNTPCFFIISNTNEEENLMICASNPTEKESWIFTIKNNIVSN
jgi:hypothetical protein